MKLKISCMQGLTSAKSVQLPYYIEKKQCKCRYGEITHCSLHLTDEQWYCADG